MLVTKRDTSVSLCQHYGTAQRIWSPEITSQTIFLPVASPSTMSRKEADGQKRGHPGRGRRRRPHTGVRPSLTPEDALGSSRAVGQVYLAITALFLEMYICMEKISKFLTLHSHALTGQRWCNSQGHSFGTSRTQENKISRCFSRNPQKFLPSLKFLEEQRPLRFLLFVREA